MPSKKPRAPKAPKPRRPTRCEKCGYLLDPVLPDCRHCGAPVPDLEVTEREASTAGVDDAEKQRSRAKGRFIPVGLIVTLVAYGLVVRTFLDYQYYDSAAYRAASRMHEAQQLLGPDDGRTVPVADLLDAIRFTIEAASLVPENAYAHRRAELLRLRMRERGVEVPDDVRRKMDFIGARWREFQESRAGDMPIGARDLWDVDAVLEAPRTAFKVALGVGFAIALVWGWVYYQEYRRRRVKELEKDRAMREDLRQLNLHRRRLQPGVRGGVEPKS